MLKFVSVLLLAGCSVNVGRVENKPPRIEPRVTTAMDQPEFGRIEFADPMDMDGVSIFLWPESKSLAQMAPADPARNCIARYGTGFDYEKLTASDKMSLKVCQVNTYSGGIDATFAELLKQLPGIRAAFHNRDCASLATSAGAVITDEIEWQTLAAGDAREPQLQQCKELKEKYSTLVSEKLARIIDLKTKLVGEIGSENWMEIDKQLSSISIRPSSVELTLKVGPVTYSTTSENADQRIRKASYSPERRLLSFEYNELDGDRHPTGSVYKFQMERIEALGMARYTGDVRLINQQGQILRNGSAQISGNMVP